MRFLSCLVLSGPAPLRCAAIAVAFCQQGPSDPGRLIGLGHAGAVYPTPGFDPLEPATPGIRFAINHPEDRSSTWMSSVRR